MKSRIESTFIQNEEFLSHSYSYERLGLQLHYLANCPEHFLIEPPYEIQRQASLLFDKLIALPNTDSSIVNTLLYVQSREISKRYLNYSRSA